MQKLNTKKSKFSASHPYIVTIVIGVFIFLFGFFVYVFPAVKKSNELSAKDILQLEVDLGSKQTKLSSIKKIAKDFDSLPKELNQKLNESLPLKPNKADLLVNLDALAKQSGLQAKVINITEAKQTARSDELTAKSQLDIKEINIKLDLDGITYIFLKHFISDVERNVRLLRINDFDFSADSPSIQLNLTAFYLEE